MLFQSQCFTNLAHRVLSLPGNEVGVLLQSNVTFSIYCRRYSCVRKFKTTARYFKVLFSINLRCRDPGNNIQIAFFLVFDGEQKAIP